MTTMQNLWSRLWECDNPIKSKAKKIIEISISNKQKYWKKNILKKSIKKQKKTWINPKKHTKSMNLVVRMGLPT